MGTFHWLKFFKSCSNVSPSHGALCLRKKLLQHGWLRGQSSCQELNPAWALRGLHPSGHIHLFYAGSSMHWTVGIFFNLVFWGVQENKASHHGPPQELHRNLCSGISSLSLFIDLDVHRAFPLTYYQLCHSLSSGFFCPFLNTLSQRCHQHTWWIHIWSVAGPVWSQLELSMVGAAPDIFSQRPLLQQCLPVNILTCTPHTKCWVVSILLQHELSNLDAFSKDDLIL